MLSPYRVLDLTTERGLFCGQILGDLGADVIKIEPPGGSPARRLAPFFEDRPDPNRSIYWWAYNRNKRSITLNLETGEGRDLLYQLAARVANSTTFIETLRRSPILGAHPRTGLAEPLRTNPDVRDTKRPYAEFLSRKRF